MAGLEVAHKKSRRHHETHLAVRCVPWITGKSWVEGDSVKQFTRLWEDLIPSANPKTEKSSERSLYFFPHPNIPTSNPSYVATRSEAWSIEYGHRIWCPCNPPTSGLSLIGQRRWGKATGDHPIVDLSLPLAHPLSRIPHGYSLAAMPAPRAALVLPRRPSTLAWRQVRVGLSKHALPRANLGAARAHRYGGIVYRFARIVKPAQTEYPTFLTQY